VDGLRDQPLAVPDSPVSRIVLLVRATVSIILKTSTIASLRPMMFENWWRARACVQQQVLLAELPFSIFSRTFILSRSMSNGLLR